METQRPFLAKSFARLTELSRDCRESIQRRSTGTCRIWQYDRNTYIATRAFGSLASKFPKGIILTGFQFFLSST